MRPGRRGRARRALGWAGALWLWAAAAAAAGPGTTGADILKINLGARPLALGGAYGAVGGDVQALAYNPAALAPLPRAEAQLLHYLALEEVGYEYAGYAQPLPGWGAVGATLLWRHLPAIDNPGAPDTPVSSNDLVVTLGTGVRLAQWWPGLPEALDSLSVGVAVKGVYLMLGENDALTGAADFGLYWRAPEGVPLRPALAAGVQNLGPGVAFIAEADPLPLQARFALACEPLRGAGHRVLVAAEAVLPSDNPPKFSGGVEYALGETFFFRAGYTVEDEQNLNTGPAAGVGAAFDAGALRFRVDYAYRPQLWKDWQSVANNHLLSLGLGF